jgi:hypothetical protein
LIIFWTRIQLDGKVAIKDGWQLYLDMRAKRQEDHV